MLVYPHDEIFIHGVIGGLQLGNGFALNHTLNIAVAHAVGRIRGNSGLYCLSDTQGGKTCAADDCLENRILAPRPDTAGHQICFGDGSLIVQVSLPYHVQQGPFRKPDTHSVMIGLGMFPVVFGIFFLKMQIAAAQFFSRDTVVYHQGVLEKQHG